MDDPEEYEIRRVMVGVDALSLAARTGTIRAEYFLALQAGVVRRCRRMAWDLVARAAELYAADRDFAEAVVARPTSEDSPAVDVEQRLANMLSPFRALGDDPMEMIRGMQLGVTLEEYLAQPIRTAWPLAGEIPAGPQAEVLAHVQALLDATARRNVEAGPVWYLRVQAWSLVTLFLMLQNERPDLAAAAKAETDPDGRLTVDQWLAGRIADVATIGDDPAAVVAMVRTGRDMMAHLADPIRRPGPGGGPADGQDGIEGPDGQAGGDRPG
jgi:hypothetical protein